jgi:hypothetical protein
LRTQYSYPRCSILSRYSVVSLINYIEEKRKCQSYSWTDKTDPD